MDLASLISELWSERGRVGLVILGVLWGTLSLTILLAFGNEFVDSVTETNRNFGPSLVRVGSGATTMPFGGWPAGRSIQLVPEDAEAVRAAVSGTTGVAIEYVTSVRNPLRYRDVRMNVSLVGCTPSFGDLRRQTPQPGGRFINERDEAEHRRVVCLGSRIKQRLFGAAPAVGETVQLWDTSFTVVGVLTPKITTTSYEAEERDKVVIPASAFRDLRGWRTISYLWVRFEDPGQRRWVMDAVRGVLAVRHGFDPADRDAVWMMDHVEIEEMIDQILDGNRIFMLFVGVIGLLVALVGVANVTYVMVEERTREIGVQMALGARPRTVALERLAEGLIVTVTGGVLGLAASAALLWLLNLAELGPEVRAYLGRPVVSLPLGVLVVVLLAAGGCLAGWFPARRAAALDPMEALREE